MLVLEKGVSLAGLQWNTEFDMLDMQLEGRQASNNQNSLHVKNVQHPHIQGLTPQKPCERSVHWIKHCMDLPAATTRRHSWLWSVGANIEQDWQDLFKPMSGTVAQSRVMMMMITPNPLSVLITVWVSHMQNKSMDQYRIKKQESACREWIYHAHNQNIRILEHFRATFKIDIGPCGGTMMLIIVLSILQDLFSAKLNYRRLDYYYGYAVIRRIKGNT